MSADFRRRVRVLVMSVALVFATAAAAQETWNWTVESVDSSAQFTWIASDDQGNIHISYSSDEGIKYAFRPAGQGRWFTMLVDPSVGFTRIAVDKDGSPHVCMSIGIIKYAVLAQHKWKVQEIAPGTGHDLGYSCSIGVAPDGTPSVTWYHILNADNSTYAHWKYAVLKDGAWLVRTVDFEGQTGKWNAMVIDRQGYPHVSYDSFILGKAKYAHFDGTKWIIETIDQRGGGHTRGYNPGVGNSIALDADNNPRVAYQDDKSLNYAFKQNGKWRLEKVDSISVPQGFKNIRSSMAIDPQGLPHIVYDDGGVLKHAYRGDDGWHLQVVAPGGPRFWRFCSIAIDGTGTLFISYSDAQDGSLKVAVGRKSVLVGTEPR